MSGHMSVEQAIAELNSGEEWGRLPMRESSAWQVIRAELDALRATPPAAAPVPADMSLAVALDFADNPRPFHALCAPADTNGELYRALTVLAANYRAALTAALTGAAK